MEKALLKLVEILHCPSLAITQAAALEPSRRVANYRDEL